MDFEIVSREECNVTGDRAEMFSKLEQDLISQVTLNLKHILVFLIY